MKTREEGEVMEGRDAFSWFSVRKLHLSQKRTHDLAAEKQEGEDAASRVCVGLSVFAASTGLLRCH